MNGILENNLLALQKRFPELHKTCVERIEQYELNDGAVVGNAYADVSVNNEFIIAVKRQERLWYLNSRYDAKAVLPAWWKGSVKSEDGKGVHYKAVVVLCGVGNADSLEYTLKKLGKENVVIAYEPDPDVFICLLANKDISELIADRRVALYVNQLNTNTLRQGLQQIMNYEVIRQSMIIMSFAYKQIYADESQKFFDICEQEIRRIYGEENTMEDYGWEIADNAIANQWMLAKSSTINQLRDYLKEQGIDMEHIPAIIVSAGPSLEKNIEELKKAKGKSLIIAVDSAIRKMLMHNIIPDIVITVDAHKPMILFNDERSKKVPIVFCGQSRKDIISQHKGKAFSFASEVFSYNVFNTAGKAMEALDSGGSVANNAFSLAEFIGIKTMILVGQDLAFTDDKKHVSGTYDEKGIGEDDENEYTYVEDIYGNRVLTYTNFKLYKEWFEGRIEDNKELEVIDATEGGARIEGALLMTLKDAVEKYCNKEFDSAILDEVPYLMNDDELGEYYEFLNGLIGRCDRLEKQFYEGIEAYDKLKMLLKRGQTGNAEFRKTNDTIAKVNAVDKTEPIMVLVSLYSAKEEMEVLRGIYDEADGIEGAISAANHGSRILEIYIKALDKVRANVNRLLKYEVSKDMYEVTEYTIRFQ